MARGKSGRIVLEIDPKLKRQLYLTLERNQFTMKEWFLKEAEDLINNSNSQTSLFEISDSDYKLMNNNESTK